MTTLTIEPMDGPDFPRRFQVWIDNEYIGSTELRGLRELITGGRAPIDPNTVRGQAMAFLRSFIAPEAPEPFQLFMAPGNYE